MADLIPRAAAIEAVRKEEEYFERSEDYDCAEAIQGARWKLQEVPVVKAIPIEWLLEYDKAFDGMIPVGRVIKDWEEGIFDADT